MKTLAVDNPVYSCLLFDFDPVDTSSRDTIDDQKVLQICQPMQTRYKVCSNGFAYITTPTTIFQQVVPASMMWFVSISLFQVVQISL